MLEVDQLTRRVMHRLGEMNLTIADLAARLGVSRPYISKLIHGGEMTASAFERLSGALGVDLEWWQRPIGLRFARRPDPAGAMLDRVRDISRE